MNLFSLTFSDVDEHGRVHVNADFRGATTQGPILARVELSLRNDPEASIAELSQKVRRVLAAAINVDGPEPVNPEKV